MPTPWIFSGALCCALAVAAGALGAHVLAARLDPDARELWEIAARYLMYSGFGQIAAGLTRSVRAAGLAGRSPVVRAGSPLSGAGLAESGLAETGPAESGLAGTGLPGPGLAGSGLAGGCLLAGAALFSGPVGGLALGGPRWLGAVPPLGGLLLIAGFALLAWEALRRPG